MSIVHQSHALDVSGAKPSTQRLYFLDWVRILAFAMLVPYHVGMYYVTWYWHVKSPFASSALEPWMRLSSPWRMSLLFVVSGAATAFMLASQGASIALLRQRTARLLLPLLCGVLVVVPPQSYFEVVQRFQFAGSFADFMQLYLSAYGGFCSAKRSCLILPTWNHLWFLPYLLCYTVLLWLSVRGSANILDRIAARADAVLRANDLQRAYWLLLLPIFYLTSTRLLLQPRYPISNALAGDWFAHSQYLALFLLGAVLARVPAVWPRFEQIRWFALGLALLSWATLVAGFNISVIRPIAFSAEQWCAIAAALGFARRHLNRDSKVRIYLTEAVFPFYILHQSVIILLAIALAPLMLPPMLEGPLLIVATFVLALLSFEGIRRIGWLRPLFGLSKATPADCKTLDLREVWLALSHKCRERLARRGA